MFGMGLGMDIGMDMGLAMGMGADMGMGRRQEIIVNKGYGGYGMGGTTIIQNGGLFGRNQEIIINNGGYGMTGMNGVTVIENGGFFGPRQEIIIGNGYAGGYGMNNVVVCQPGCTNSCCRRVCAPGCQLSCCVPTHQQVYQQPQAMVAYQQQTQYQKPVQHHHNHHQKAVYKAENFPKGNVVEQNIVVGSPINPYQNQGANNMPKYQMQQQILVCHHLFELRYGKWEGPRDYILNRTNFDKYPLSFITKVKTRTDYEPFSDMLENGQIILKVCTNNQQMFFAAKPHIIKKYFDKIIMIKSRFNQFQQFQYTDYIEGPILKKSNFLGNWQERFVKITKFEGLKSYKNPNQNHSLHIKSIRQLWTWFEIVNGKYMLIKLKHNGMKMQFGIPLNRCGPWIQAFFSLLQTYD